MQTLDGLLQGIVAEPLDEDRWLVLADWLEEHDDPRRAELMRLHRRLLATCCEPERHPEREEWQARVVELLTQGVRPCVPQTTVVVGDAVAITFSFIPPGTFLMGSPTTEENRSNDETPHRVTLTKGLWMGATLVTKAQWQAVMGSNPGNFKGDDRPVEEVSWDDCQEFCTKLGQKDGKRSRLPTEAEWEYACRAGTTSPYHSGNDLAALKRVGWCSYDGEWGSAKQTKPVGQFQPNGWGLWDIHGNVWEWCLDWYGPYPSSDIKDPQGYQNGNTRVLRGGSWFDLPDGCRSALRRRYAPSFGRSLVGCRVVLCLD